MCGAGGQYFDVHNTALTYFTAPSCTYLEQYLAVYFNAALTFFSVPALTYVGQNLAVYVNAALTFFSAPALTFIGQYLDIDSNPALLTIAAPALKTIANIGNLNGASVTLCSNSAQIKYSSQIRSAGAGSFCALGTDGCSPTTC